MMNLPECKIILDKLKNELPSQIYYHTIEHTLDVYNCAEIIAKKEGVTTSNLKLLLIAAIYHDTGYLLQNTNQEKCSCQVAKQYLAKYHYTKEDITVICNLIMATKIPQNPKTHLEKIICDADLDYLGRDDFFSIGNNLYKELLAFGKVKTVDEWNSVQESFMKQHHYFTATSINSRQSQKEKNLKIIQSKIKK